MTPFEQLTMKRFLEVLDQVGAGLPAEAVFDQLERMFARCLTTLEREHALNWMTAKGWIGSYRCPLTDRVLYTVKDSGRMAMIAL